MAETFENTTTSSSRDTSFRRMTSSPRPVQEVPNGPAITTTTATVVDYTPDRACIHSPTKIFQAVMFLAFIIALIVSVTVKYKTVSVGLIWGGFLSLFSVIFVIVSYIAEPTYQRHPNPLIFYRTIADAIFVVRLLAEQFSRCVFFQTPGSPDDAVCEALCNNDNFQCGCSNQAGSSELCIVYAGILEFSLIAAECWFFCMSVNLFMSLTNPFTDFKKNMKYFHMFCWGSGLLMALLLTLPNNHNLAGYSNLGFCWTNTLKDIDAVDPDTCTLIFDVKFILEQQPDSVLDANLSSWLFFYVWIALFLIFSFVIWIWAWKRLSEGMPETYAVRVQSINRSRFYIIVVTLYWTTALIVYISYLSTNAAKAGNVLSEFMNFLLAARGYVDLIVWFSLNDFRIPDLKRFANRKLYPVDVDLGPQVNAALRREVLFYTTSGIIQAVRAAQQLPPGQTVQHLSLLPRSSTPQLNTETINESEVFDNSMRVARHPERTKTFHDFEPHAFRKIRERFGVENDLYLRSLSTTAKERLSEGASGAFMFFSGDGSLIVKSTSLEEAKFLKSIAAEYSDYLCRNPTSLLTRFYGCHCLELYGKAFHFIVMANLFDTDQVIHSRYDIKGSWVNRNAELPKAGKKVTCRHCNRKYVYQSTAFDDFNCPDRLGGHVPSFLAKDNDLTQKLRLNEDVAIALYQQLKQDTELLYSFGIMDYSLLMGINDVEYLVEDASIFGNDNTTLINDTGNENTEDAINPFSNQSMMDSSGNVLLRGHETTTTTTTSSTSPPAPLGSRSFSSSSQHRLPKDGMRLANTVVGPAYYHLGVIDILQSWTLKKRLERKLKIYLKRVDGDGLSAIPPKPYRDRFLAKMADILGIQNILPSEQRSSFEHVFQHTTNMDLEPETSDNPAQLLRSLTSDNHLVSSLHISRPKSARKNAEAGDSI